MVTTTVSRNDYIGNGAVSEYAYSFPIINSSDLDVSVSNPLVDPVVNYSLLENVDYTVTGAGLNSNRKITLNNLSQAWLTAGKLTTGFTITVRREVDIKQGIDFRNSGDSFRETQETGFDYGVMIAQQQQEQLDRTIRLPVTFNPAGFNLELPSDLPDHPGGTLAINDNGDGLTIGPTLAQFLDLANQAGESADSAAAADASAQAAALSAQTALDAADVAVTNAQAAQASSEAAADSAQNSVDEITALIGSILTQTNHNIPTDQALSNLTGETLDGAMYKSCMFNMVVIRGTDIFYNISKYAQYKNSTWILLDSDQVSDNDPDHGITFDISQVGAVGTLQMAVDTGDTGDLIIKKTFFANP